MSRNLWVLGTLLVFACLGLGACAARTTTSVEATTRQQVPAASTAATDPEVKVDTADLERLVGSYADEEMGFAFQVDLVGDRLRLTVTEGPPFPPSLLIPTSPVRFRWEGEGLAPGLAVVFQGSGEKATALTVLQPGKPEVMAKRSE